MWLSFSFDLNLNLNLPSLFPVLEPLDLLCQFFYYYRKAGIAQLVECELPKLEATGSIPVARSKNLEQKTYSPIGELILAFPVPFELLQSKLKQRVLLDKLLVRLFYP
jgi:hypothetical protein